MAYILYGIRNCDTVKKALAWLQAAGFDYHFHDYKVEGIDAETLARWAAGLGWEKLLNRSGTTFRKLPTAQTMQLDESAAIRLMMDHTSIIRRPILEGEGVLLVGFRPEIYADALGRGPIA